MNEINSPYSNTPDPEELSLAKRKQRDEDTAQLFFGQTDLQVRTICREAVEAEQQQRRIAAFANAARNLLSEERFLAMKMVNRK